MLAFQKYIYYLCSKPNTTKQLFRTGEELFEQARLKKNTVHSTIHSFTTMKKLSLALVALSALLFTSCATIATPAGVGALYTDMQSGETATSNTVGNKVGTAEATNLLGLLVMGDASINAAAKKAGIKKISHVDSQKTSLLGLFSKYTIFVYGE